MRIEVLRRWSMPERWAKLDLNRPAGNWRERLAELLRRLAQRLDGRVSLAVELKSSAALSRDELFEVIDAGADAMLRHANVLVTAASIEQVMQDCRPDLYAPRQKARS